jgi:hypothetical protein
MPMPALIDPLMVPLIFDVPIRTFELTGYSCIICMGDGLSRS